MKLRRVSGDSMAPTLADGQLVVVVRRRRVRSGDVVMIRHGGLEKVKRVSRVQDDKLFLKGDNPASSTDSRQFGWINRNIVEGKIVWPMLKNRSYQK